MSAEFLLASGCHQCATPITSCWASWPPWQNNNLQSHVTLHHCSASMSTQSLEQQKLLYSRELAAYTLRQWTAARNTIDSQRLDACLSSAMRDISLASPGPSTAREKKGTRRRTASLAGAPDHQTERVGQGNKT
ncbi:hypothetical protein P692DRAFT_20143574 [Suillus brevipes Sb2]|nr:hypothetical protein P692DRAFT_20143574 [Suillus brevipes Sb2]